jgi:hypothetical protein
MRTIKSAETLTYQKADELGVDSDTVVPGSVQGSLRNSSLKDAMNTLGGWQARTPAEVTAEYYQIGNNSLLAFSFYS